MKKSFCWNNWQEVRFICYQDVFILVENVLGKRYGRFILELAIIKDTGARSIRSRSVNEVTSFIDHVAFSNSRIPDPRVDLGILVLKKFDDGFPGARRKPLTARANSIDDWKR